jgi:adenylyltransferase/sulfurtransferase
MKTPPLVTPGPALTVDEVRRYSRHLIIPDVAMAGQQRMMNAKVLCVGAGGLGSPALMYLAAAGVGTLGIVEFDTVDESNLQRQIIHGQSDIGKSKAVSAKEKIAEINPYVKVVLHETRLDNSNVMEIFSQYDIIVDGTDNFATRYLVNDACVLLKKPYVWGSIYRFDGQASVFFAEHGPCYRCLYPEPPAKELAPNCAVGGVFGALCGTIGSFQATEVIKLITGVGSVMVGDLLIYDALQATYEKIELNKNPDCSLCGENPTQTHLLADYEDFCSVSLFENIGGWEIPIVSSESLAAMIVAGSNFSLIDVREPSEWDEGRIDGAILIPQGEFFGGTAAANISRDSPVVLYCAHGIRSASCAGALIQAGFNHVASLDGGIVAWQETMSRKQGNV